MITCTLTPRAYQAEAVDNTIAAFADGHEGVLIRSFTGSGKTPMACMVAEQWLNSSSYHKVMIISYEKQLIWQFAQEVEDFLGVTPGIEMGNEKLLNEIPDIVVCSRASLLKREGLSEQQVERFEKAGFDYTLARHATGRRADTLLNYIDEGQGDAVYAELEKLAETSCVGPDGSHSRVYKFDPDYNWLTIYDEAHKHAYHLRSVGHIFKWFATNPVSRRLGLTATPRRFDGVSIGDKMFPGVALDFPLASADGKDAVSEGYAVPYRVRYIVVTNVDFKSLKKVAGDFSEEELGRVLGEEKVLAGLCGPLLDVVGRRKCLIFSPTVKMAEDVRDYLNARSQVRCEGCSSDTDTCLSWTPRYLIGDGAKCDECGHEFTADDIVSPDTVCHSLDGTTPLNVRQEVYRGHKTGEFQFLSVCGLCKEGYNDQEIACVAIFRPVSKKAVSLSEQMMGRGARPLKGLIEGIGSAEDRRNAIATSAKPDCLIVDLVGATGLQDASSAVQIYAEGKDDEVIKKAEKRVLDGETDVQKAIEEAEAEVEQSREEQRALREEEKSRAARIAAERAKAQPEVEYSVHDTGHWDKPQGAVLPNGASDKQVDFILSLGLDLAGYPITKAQAGRIIRQLKDEKKTIAEVKRTNKLPSNLPESAGPPASMKQLNYLKYAGIPTYKGITKREASELIEIHKTGGKPKVESHAKYEKGIPSKDYNDLVEAIGGAASTEELTSIAKIAGKQKTKMSGHQWESIVDVGKRRRKELSE